jgi:hypothetical protein
MPTRMDRHELVLAPPAFGTGTHRRPGHGLSVHGRDALKRADTLKGRLVVVFLPERQGPGVRLLRRWTASPRDARMRRRLPDSWRESRQRPAEPTMSDRSKKTPPALTNRNVEEQTRLSQIRRLWSQLARLRANSAEHRELVNRIRKEADEFRKLTDKSSGEP